MCIREELLSLQYAIKEAYDMELMQHGNTMQELVLVKQWLESGQECWQQLRKLSEFLKQN